MNEKQHSNAPSLLTKEHIQQAKESSISSGSLTISGTFLLQILEIDPGLACGDLIALDKILNENNKKGS